MGFMLLCSRKRCLTSDIMSEKPSKKIKLEFQNAGNDELWGQDDDITAEEFDLLEIQATQSCNQNNNLLNNTLPANSFLPKSSNSVEVHDLKQLQYELEGRVKLLSFALEKATKELNEERQNREQLINEKMKQSHDREVNLKKEVEKMQSVLEFKDQEMKSTYSKLQMMKSQLQDKKSVNSVTPLNSNFEDFLNSSKSGGQSVRSNTTIPEKYSRKYKLSVDVPKGEVTGMEILSSILCTRLVVPPIVNKESLFNFGCSADSSFSSSLTPLSVLYFKNEQKCDEILEYYCNFLKNHVNLLKSLALKNNQVTLNKNFPVLTKTKEAFCSQTIVAHLTDITYIYSSPSLKSFHQNLKTEHESPSTSMDITTSERPLSSCVQKNVFDSTQSLVQSLLALSKPEIYPVGYHKNEEMEYALSALLSVCVSNPKEFLNLIEEPPCYFFSNPLPSITGFCAAIKLLITLCPQKSFIQYLAHKESNCIFCLVAALLNVTVPLDPEKFSMPLVLVVDFLSSLFLIHNYKETQLEASSCISKVIQGIIKSLWKYFQVRDNNMLSFEILRKGFLLLHFISTNVPNFKEKRTPVEDEYISLVSGILAISKEHNELRHFYDLIHNLWDFQTDMSEFDLDELSEETHACTNDIE